ncbi:unnamed protein product [Mycena citricolor]|uniref:Uncharacterized protein n=1 Tax=Mycena citricolor TaxID=2018698 RepID=A0AAD2JV06_9AGAR|nr:unnamed protein product [Mycena citricolor]
MQIFLSQSLQYVLRQNAVAWQRPVGTQDRARLAHLRLPRPRTRPGGLGLHERTTGSVDRAQYGRDASTACWQNSRAEEMAMMMMLMGTRNTTSPAKNRTNDVCRRSGGMPTTRCRLKRRKSYLEIHVFTHATGWKGKRTRSFGVGTPPPTARRVSQRAHLTSSVRGW